MNSRRPDFSRATFAKGNCSTGAGRGGAGSVRDRYQSDRARLSSGL